MRATQIKKQLHNYIDTADDKKLKAIYTLLRDDISLLSDAQKIELDKRMLEHKNGIGRTYNWDETLAIARK